MQRKYIMIRPNENLLSREQLKQALLDTGHIIDNEWLDKYLDVIDNNRQVWKVKYKTVIFPVIPKAFCETDQYEHMEYQQAALAMYYICKCVDKEYYKKLWVRFVYFAHIREQLEEDEIIKLLPYIQIENIAYQMRCIGNKSHKVSKAVRKKISKAQRKARQEFPEHYETTEHKREAVRATSALKNEPGRLPPETYKIIVEKRRKWFEQAVSIHKGNKFKHVHKDKLNEYLNDGWQIGYPPDYGKQYADKVGVRKGETITYVDPDQLNQYIADGWKPGTWKKEDLTQHTLLKLLSGECTAEDLSKRQLMYLFDFFNDETLDAEEK